MIFVHNQLCLSLIILCHSLTETIFTNRFSDWITRQIVIDECGYECTCANDWKQNLCVCIHGNDDPFYIESPYAALLIQSKCFISIVDVPKKPNPIEVNMASVFDSNIVTRTPPIVIDGSEGVIVISKIIPKPFSIR